MSARIFDRGPAVPAAAVNLLRGAGGFCALVLTLALLPAPVAAKRGSADESTREANADDLLIVDCLLPARVRRLGGRSTFLAPRRPIKTTAADCRIRGGEYTEPDQADYRTALQVWLPQAKAGDPEAQFYAGQIFEQGLGIAPDFANAVEWYRQAAEQDYAPAQVNLGFLYEQGLGVEKDEAEALKWYRRAAGAAEDLVVLEQADYVELVAAREDLVGKTAEVEQLQSQVEALRQQLSSSSEETEESRRQQTTLKSLLENLEQELNERNRALVDRGKRLQSLEQALAQQLEDTAPTAETVADTAMVRREIDFGGYHALVIGNGNYRQLPALETAVNDAREVADLLQDKYGFEVRLLLDATRYEMMTALNELREELTSEDNLLVYYAGHGSRDLSSDTGFWQPVDAAPDSRVDWIPNAMISEHLDLVPARHVLVVADGHFSGLRTRSAVAQLPAGMTDEERFHHLRLMTERRSRLVLTSGGLRPRAAGEGAKSSRFSSAFVSVLQQNQGVLEASRIYRQVHQKVAGETDAAVDSEVPAFAAMRWARNNVADFFFVPRSGS